jgi:hypothetical protein
MKQPPINLPPLDLSRSQQIPITQPFSENEVEKIIGMFDEADRIEKDVLARSQQLDYPFPVHVLALPRSSHSLWLQGVSVQRIQQDQYRSPTIEIYLQLTLAKDIMSGIIYIPHKDVLYLAVRALDHPVIVIENNILEQYAKKV